MLIYNMPYFLVYVIPMSIMMSVLLTFLRMSNDNEILALKAGGMSIYGLLPPVVLFSLIGCLLTGLLSVYGLPWGRLSFKEKTYEVASSHADVGLKERTFNDNFEDVMIYINKIDLKTNALIDVFIEDKRNRSFVSTVIAPRGDLVSETGGSSYRLRLFDGTINQVSLNNRSVNTLRFDTYDFLLDIKKAMSTAGGQTKDERDMSLTELRRYLKNAPNKDVQYYAALIEFHKKFSIAFACLALGILAVPLGVQLQSAKRSYALSLGLICFFAYYLMLSAGWVFGETGVYPPVIGMWLPNIIMGGLGLVLLYKVAHERSLNMGWLWAWIRRGK